MFSTISVHENVGELWISAYSRLHSAGCVPCALFAHWHRRAVKCDFLYTADLAPVAPRYSSKGSRCTQFTM